MNRKENGVKKYDLINGAAAREETQRLLTPDELVTMNLFELIFSFPEASAWTDIFIYPGYKFKAMDALITNFHLPESTLVMLVSAFADREKILNAYNIAVQERYRFFSFGDAMFIS